MLGSPAWLSDWVVSVPLILLNVLIHVGGLAFMNELVIQALERRPARRHFMLQFGLVVGGTTLLAVVLHALGAVLWALAFLGLGLLPDERTAMLYSISAMTTYGHHDIFLPNDWRMMGALESLTGMLLFGLTTAFLFAVIQKVWPLGTRLRRG